MKSRTVERCSTSEILVDVSHVIYSITAVKQLIQKRYIFRILCHTFVEILPFDLNGIRYEITGLIVKDEITHCGAVQHVRDIG